MKLRADEPSYCDKKARYKQSKNRDTLALSHQQEELIPRVNRKFDNTPNLRVGVFVGPVLVQSVNYVGVSDDFKKSGAQFFAALVDIEEYLSFSA
jgi:hypothetical protein